MKKISYNDMKTNGFRTKSQMRYLLHLANEYPEKFAWVFDVLRDHGVPEADEALNTYWEAPYNVSPETPSYKYISRRSASIASRLQAFAEKLDILGYDDEADKIDVILLPNREKEVERVANTFWVINVGVGEDISSVDRLKQLFDRLENFNDYKALNSEDRTKVRERISTKMLGEG